MRANNKLSLKNLSVMFLGASALALSACSSLKFAPEREAQLGDRAPASIPLYEPLSMPAPTRQESRGISTPEEGRAAATTKAAPATKSAPAATTSTSEKREVFPRGWAALPSALNREERNLREEEQDAAAESELETEWAAVPTEEKGAEVLVASNESEANLDGRNVTVHKLAGGDVEVRLKVSGLTSNMWVTTEVINHSTKPLKIAARDLLQFENATCLQDRQFEPQPEGILKPGQSRVGRYSFRVYGEQTYSPEHERCKDQALRFRIGGLQLGSETVQPRSFTIE